MSPLDVFLVPALIPPNDTLADATVVVIDVLRAGSTITTALAHGAREVVPFEEVEQARSWAAQQPEPVLLGGERAGVRIEGFNLGNSPCEYASEQVAGRGIGFTTTNGTRALARCRGARQVYWGTFLSASACVARLSGAAHVVLLCAGTRGEVSRDDVLFAGLVVDALCRRDAGHWTVNDAARLAADAWRAICSMGSAAERESTAAAATRGWPTPARLAAELAESQGGRDLLALGLGRDLDDVAQLDRFHAVAQWHRDRGAIDLGGAASLH